MGLAAIIVVGLSLVFAMFWPLPVAIIVGTILWGYGVQWIADWHAGFLLRLARRERRHLPLMLPAPIRN